MERMLQRAASLMHSGDLGQAARVLERAIAHFPKEAAPHRALALLASRAGRNEAAVDHMAHAVALAPDSTDLRFQLASLLALVGRLDDAGAEFQRVIEIAPGHLEAHFLLATVLQKNGQNPQALTILRHAYGMAPGHARIARALAELEFRIGYPDDALPLWRTLAEASPNDVEITLRYGETLSRLGFHGQTLELYRDRLRRRPDEPDLWMALAQSQEDQGDRDAAESAYLRALQLKPGWAFPLSGLLGLRRGKALDEWIAAAQQARSVASLPDSERALLGYELGKVLDGRSDYPAAMACWRDANEARRRVIGAPAPGWLEAQVEQAKRSYRPEPRPRGAVADSDAPAPVFIVGMPRSGTTLTEQIIASHPQAHGAGELPDIALIARRLTPALATADMASATMDTLLADARRRYLAAAMRHADTSATRLVDKAPLNFFHLGLIALLFPNARIIWCRRDPRDIAVSIYGENFALEEKLATDLGDIGHYINAQTRLMRHWQSVLPLPIHESRYEELATTLEPQSRQLIEFIGLPWDSACLDFHLNDRGVQTPSRWQVRQPIHTRSVGRWRHYAVALQPLLDVLDADAY